MSPHNPAHALWIEGATLVAAVLFASAGLGCATPRSGLVPEAPVTRWVVDRLYFGMAPSDSAFGPVTEGDWSAFLADFVTPRFPAGLTVWDACGQWRDRAPSPRQDPPPRGQDPPPRGSGPPGTCGEWHDPTGRIRREPSKVLEIVHEVDRAADAKVFDIVRAYEQRFHQRSVLHVRLPCEATF